MRTSKEAHPQLRHVTIPLLMKFKETVPILFEDIVPESRQVENISKGR
jgi:thymidylate synthase (FAD)